ncbi:MAG: saccharopine dehydrogenase [Acidobacteria bacterium]|nr:MAG: saccharopine dehydrogenase [Acidobacteriota bacterium]REK03047.1 MAG: saccharopine dehydrogenase [Acidobacteriota bacterium]REK13149.1 MAG: saccharopine dehydrogenase [Acidobacteriota bacterium]REK41143.1 MAG: saccharopine dehydrogenase [Acidobacteriota bacterium]
MKILVLGAGRMGFGAAFDLAHNSPKVQRVTIADQDISVAEAAADKTASDKVSPLKVDVSDSNAVSKVFADHDAAISCVNYWFNEELSKLAILNRSHLCDLGGNNGVVDRQLALDAQAREAGISIIPDCGLAPGMVSVLAVHGASRFDILSEIHIRVGGLPQHPEPPLDYQLVFSVEGLINEYVEKARVIRKGEILEIESMTELEHLEFEGYPPLEAFQTSGGTSTLPDSFGGKVTELDYKTIRYRGHCDKFKTMIDLGLCSSDPLETQGAEVAPRRILARLLELHLPADGPDLVFVRLEFEGQIAGARKTLVYDIVDKQDNETGLSAMMRTTSFPASIIAQMMVEGEVALRGATPQEAVIGPESFVEELSRRGIAIDEYFRD